MDIDLPQDLKTYLHQQVATGHFKNEHEVIQFALEQLRGHQLAEHAWKHQTIRLKQELAKGLEDAESGRLQDAALVLDHTEQKSRDRLKN